jgi:hypothetical protein
MQPIHLSLAALPGLRHEEAARTAHIWSQAGLLSEPLLGAIRLDRVQLVPQGRGVLDFGLCETLQEEHPNTQFRLHANCRVLPARHVMADLSGLSLHEPYFDQAAKISKALCAQAYSAHAGRRSEATMGEMMDNARRLSDRFDCPVAIEGHYPDAHNTWLVNSWSEYEQVWASGLPYALDLSHLNILRHKTRHTEWDLISEMLSSDQCLEVHVSANDGHGDQHQICADEVWWWDVLQVCTHPDAVIFSEGNHRSRGKPV